MRPLLMRWLGGGKGRSGREALAPVPPVGNGGANPGQTWSRRSRGAQVFRAATRRSPSVLSSRESRGPASRDALYIRSGVLEAGHPRRAQIRAAKEGFNAGPERSQHLGAAAGAAGSRGAHPKGGVELLAEGRMDDRLAFKPAPRPPACWPWAFSLLAEAAQGGARAERRALGDGHHV